jgi:alpha-N-acetylglucosaminidase
MCAAVSGSGISFDFSGRGSAIAVKDLLVRVLGNESAAAQFDLKIVDSCGPQPDFVRSKLCFNVSGGGAHKIVVRGTSGVDLARGCAHYLRRKCNMSFAWERTGGNLINVPPVWPEAGNEIHYRQTDVSTYQNVVASSYSHPWWSFDDWSHFIDWEALNGVNLALAFTGQEEVYRKVFAEVGISADIFGNWSNGVAWLSWSR